MNMPRHLTAIGKAAAMLLPLAGAISLPFYFMYSDVISSALARVLRLEIDPALAGGRILARFADPLGDDRGSGGLEPPLSPNFGEGELDLVGYTVRQPATRAVWSERPAFWQLEVRFARAIPTGFPEGGFRAPAVHIYIDLDGAASGSQESAYGAGELVRFDTRWPWDYAISANGHEVDAAIRSADGKYEAAVEQIWNQELGRLTLRVDLLKAPPLLSSVLAGGETAHYVLSGAYDGAREGRFASVREYPSLHSGGGARSDFAPWVYDLIAPRNANQRALLSSEDPSRGSLAVLQPVHARGTPEAAAGPEPGGRDVRARLEKASQTAAEEEAGARKARLEALPPSKPSADAVILAELFDLGLEERALAATESALSLSPGDPLALAYRGALVALQADRAQGVAEKMRLVAKAYRDLDAAVESIGTGTADLSPDESIRVLLCRANVSAAVPDSVFGKALQGAKDFDAAFRLAQGNPVLEARCLAGAAQAYELAGRSEEAATRWATLSGREGLPAKSRLELFDRGYDTVETVDTSRQKL